MDFLPKKHRFLFAFHEHLTKVLGFGWRIFETIARSGFSSGFCCFESISSMFHLRSLIEGKESTINNSLTTSIKNNKVIVVSTKPDMLTTVGKKSKV
jgi:hypothetical protein